MNAAYPAHNICNYLVSRVINGLHIVRRWSMVMAWNLVEDDQEAGADRK